jgi:hypothetical protein
MHLRPGLGLGNVRGNFRPAWLLPFGPTLDVEMTASRAFLNGAHYAAEAGVKALFSTFSTPVCNPADADGVLRPQLAGGMHCFGTPAGKALGQLIEEARTNKCTSYNAAPAAIAPTDPTTFNAAAVNAVATGDAAALYGSVADAVELAAAGLSGVVSRVSKIDCAAGSSIANISDGGLNGNTNPHVTSAYTRGGTGLIGLTSSSAGQRTAFTADAHYRRLAYAIAAPINNSRGMRMVDDAGQTIWYCLQQLEEGAFATSPIVTAGAAVTRAASSIVRTLGSEFNASGFSALFSGKVPAYAGIAANLGQLDDGGNNNRIVVQRSAADKLVVLVIVAGATVATLDLGAVAPNDPVKVAFRAAANDYAASLNGAAVVTNAGASVPGGLTSLRLGSNVGGNYWNSYVARAVLWKALLADAQLRQVAA